MTAPEYLNFQSFLYNIHIMKEKRILTQLVTVLLILLFTYAATSKFVEHDKFRFQLIRAPFIRQFSSFLSFALPVGELLITALLIKAQTRLLGLWLSFVSMLVFTIYVAAMLLSHQHLPCT